MTDTTIMLTVLIHIYICKYRAVDILERTCTEAATRGGDKTRNSNNRVAKFPKVQKEEEERRRSVVSSWRVYTRICDIFIL